MEFKEFQESLDADQPPEGIPPLLLALWLDARKEWERAHSITQEIESREAAWIHAYLHRREGDLPNAEYWYRRAGRSNPGTELEREWNSLARFLCSSTKRD